MQIFRRISEDDSQNLINCAPSNLVPLPGGTPRKQKITGRGKGHLRHEWMLQNVLKIPPHSCGIAATRSAAGNEHPSHAAGHRGAAGRPGWKIFALSRCVWCGSSLRAFSHKNGRWGGKFQACGSTAWPAPWQCPWRAAWLRIAHPQCARKCGCPCSGGAGAGRGVHIDGSSAHSCTQPQLLRASDAPSAPAVLMTHVRRTPPPGQQTCEPIMNTFDAARSQPCSQGDSLTHTGHAAQAPNTAKLGAVRGAGHARHCATKSSASALESHPHTSLSSLWPPCGQPRRPSRPRRAAAAREQHSAAAALVGTGGQPHRCAVLYCRCAHAHFSSRAATPGSTLPSSSSREAPPPGGGGEGGEEEQSEGETK